MKTFIYICLLVIGLVLPAGAQVPIQSYRGHDYGISVATQHRHQGQGLISSHGESADTDR